MADIEKEVQQRLESIWTLSKRISKSLQKIQTNRDLYLPLSDIIENLVDAVPETVVKHITEDDKVYLDQISVELASLDASVEARSTRDPVFGTSVVSMMNPWTALRRRGDDKVEADWWQGILDRHLRVFEKTTLTARRRYKRSELAQGSQEREDSVDHTSSQVALPELTARRPTIVDPSTLERLYSCTIEWDEEMVDLLRHALRNFADSDPAMHTDHEAQAWVDWLDAMLQRPGLDLQLYKKALRHLRQLCHKSGKLPIGCTLTSDIDCDREPISSSSFSDVYKGTLGGRSVALKRLRLHIDDQDAVLEAFLKEASLWRSLRHANIVQFLGVSQVFRVCIVSLWMSNGTIPQYLRAHPNTNRVSILKHIVSGLTYMHSLDLVHGDIKPANVLVDDGGNACLTDFGLVSVLHTTNTFSQSVSGGGTYRWMAPELLAGEEDGAQPSFASDIYAFAILTWEVFSGKKPYNELRFESQVRTQVLRGRRPARPPDTAPLGLSDELWGITMRSWDEKAEIRPSLAKIAEVLGENE